MADRGKSRALRAAYTFFCERRGEYDSWGEAVTAAWQAGAAIQSILERNRVETMALSENWQKDYEAVHNRATEILQTEPELRLEEQLHILLEQEAKDRQILNNATAVMTKRDHVPSAEETSRYRVAQDKWLEIAKAVTEKTDALRQQELEARNAPIWREQYNALVKKLESQYQGLGPQYELLIGRLAAVEIKLQQMEHSGREIGSTEYKQWHDIHLNYIKRLQDHTESRTTRVENIDTQLRLVTVAIVEYIQRRMMAFNPEGWHDTLLGLPGVIEAKKMDLIAEAR